MKKRIVALTLAVMMTVSTLAGCGSSTSGSTATGSTGESSEAKDTELAAGEKVKLSALFIAHPLTKDVNEMQWVQEIEDKAGVEIEWEQIYTDWETVKATRFASGDIPDLVFNATIA